MKKTDVSQEKVLIGKAGSPVGIKGEFRVTMYSGDNGNLKEGKVLLLERGAKNASGETDLSGSSARSQYKAAISRVRYQKDKPVVKLEGIDDRNAAEEIRGMEISIMADDLEELPEGEHYVRDLIGLTVVDVSKGPVSGSADDSTGENPDGAVIGLLADVIQNTAQSILDVRTPEGKSVLIPAVDAFLKSIDEEAGIIEVELIPGFLD